VLRDCRHRPGRELKLVFIVAWVPLSIPNCYGWEEIMKYVLIAAREAGINNGNAGTRSCLQNLKQTKTRNHSPGLVPSIVDIRSSDSRDYSRQARWFSVILVSSFISSFNHNTTQHNTSNAISTNITNRRHECLFLFRPSTNAFRRPTLHLRLPSYRHRLGFYYPFYPSRSQNSHSSSTSHSLFSSRPK